MQSHRPMKYYLTAIAALLAVSCGLPLLPEDQEVACALAVMRNIWAHYYRGRANGNMIRPVHPK